MQRPYWPPAACSLVLAPVAGAHGDHHPKADRQESLPLVIAHRGAAAGLDREDVALERVIGQAPDAA